MATETSSVQTREVEGTGPDLALGAAGAVQAVDHPGREGEVVEGACCPFVAVPP